MSHERYLDGILNSKSTKLYKPSIEHGAYLLTSEIKTIYSQFSDGQSFERILIKQFENISFDCNSYKNLSFNNNSKKEDFNLHLYPNPTDNQIQIESPDPKNTSSVHIRDTEGSVILFRKFSAGNLFCKIKVDSWPSGIYFVTIENGLNKYSSKFVKK